MRGLRRCLDRASASGGPRRRLAGGARRRCRRSAAPRPAPRRWSRRPTTIATPTTAMPTIRSEPVTQEIHGANPTRAERSARLGARDLLAYSSSRIGASSSRQRRASTPSHRVAEPRDRGQRPRRGAGRRRTATTRPARTQDHEHARRRWPARADHSRESRDERTSYPVVPTACHTRPVHGGSTGSGPQQRLDGGADHVGDRARRAVARARCCRRTRARTGPRRPPRPPAPWNSPIR